MKTFDELTQAEQTELRNADHVAMVVESRHGKRLRRPTIEGEFHPGSVYVITDENHNYGCTDCTGCKFCLNCHDCLRCSSCTDCTGCRTCGCCTRCTYCSDCEDCVGCRECVELCEQLKDCKECYRCTCCIGLVGGDDDNGIVNGEKAFV